MTQTAEIILWMLALTLAGLILYAVDRDRMRWRRQALAAQRDVDALSAGNASLLKAVSHWITRAQSAELRVQELWTEHFENQAYFRELKSWKKDLDPNVAKLTPEQLDRLWSDLWKPVRPSPSSYVADPDAVFCPRVVEVDR